MIGWFLARRVERTLNKTVFKERDSAGSYDSFLIKFALIFIACLLGAVILMLVVINAVN
jgi:hypothetical protein